MMVVAKRRSREAGNDVSLRSAHYKKIEFIDPISRIQNLLVASIYDKPFYPNRNGIMTVAINVE
jgi:hypothetical protein